MKVVFGNILYALGKGIDLLFSGLIFLLEFSVHLVERIRAFFAPLVSCMAALLFSMPVFFFFIPIVRLPVRNVVDFGAFVDIGIHEDGLIHISKLSNSYVKHPSQVVSVGDLVTVWVDKLDIEREKVNLSLVAPRESN